MTNFDRPSFADELPALLPRLWRFAVVLSKAPDVADDLVQASCVRALERAQQFSPGTRLDSWLFRIMASIWKNQLRAERIRRGNGFADPEIALVVDGQRQIEMNIFAAEVLDEVNRLPEAQRTTIMLAYVEGFSYRETALILDIPVGTVMSRLAAARCKLAGLKPQPTPLAAAVVRGVRE